MIEKKMLRNQIKEKLYVISKPLYEQYCSTIALELYSDSMWKSAQTIGITISNPPEVDTFKIIRKGWEEGKQIVVPKCHPKEKRMDFRVLKDFNQLESVFYGLLEPIEAKTKYIAPEEIDLLIVPGLAFSKQGYRLGFGGGYYDRFLNSFSGNTLSLAFQEQIVNQLPIESHDIPVKKIITNKESYISLL